MLDSFENSDLEKESASVASTEQKKARQRLAKEITELVSDARQQLAGNSSIHFAVTMDLQTADLFARTETLVKVLLCEGKT